MDISRGVLFERLSLIADIECAISHDIEAIIFYLADLEELELTKKILKEEDNISDIKAIDSKIETLNDEIEKRKSLLKTNTALRRKYMKTLDVNHRDWCSIKHFVPAVTKALEIWQATNNEDDFLLLKEIYKEWAKRLSITFKIDYSECYRCLADKIKGEK